MAHIDQAQFESLWQRVKDRPSVRQGAAAPIHADLSLTGILTNYMAMAATGREWGKISQQEFNDLETAVNALRAVLARIKDSELVTAAAAANAAAIQQKLSRPKS
jgi:hypothetical protein